MAQNRTLSIVGLYLAGVAGALGVVIATGLLPPHPPFAAVIKLASALIAGLIWVTFAGTAWRRTDEAAREAHRSAWFWGAPFGFAAAFAALVIAAKTSAPHDVFRSDVLAALHGHMPQQPLVLIACGVLIAIGAELIGYAIAWAIWWLRKSSH